MAVNGLVLLYGWNAYEGRTWHHLTGTRAAGNNRPETVCGRTVRAIAEVPQPGYVECAECRRIVAQ